MIYFVHLFFLSFLFYLSYLTKSFQFLMISITYLSLFAFFLQRFNKNICLLIFSILITFTIIENVLYFKKYKTLFKLANQNNFAKNIKYIQTFLGYQPNAGVQIHKVTRDGKELLNATYTITENNFRHTPEINSIRKNKKINFFGGSMVFGWGVNDDQTIPYFIQYYFKKSEINNFAVAGYGVHQMLRLIEEKPEFIGDVNILMTDSAHIPRATCKRDYSFGTPKYVLGNKNEVVRSGYCGFGIIDKIKLPKVIGSIVNRSEVKKIFNDLFEKNFKNTEKEIELYLAILNEINKLILKNNKILIIGYMNTNDKINNEIFYKIKKSSFNIVDLTLDKAVDEYWLPDRHTSSTGNKKRSKMLSEYIMNKISIN